MKLVALDGDNTLWTPVNGLNLSDRTPTDDIGDPDFSFSPSSDDPLLVVRSDGARFALRPEARAVLEALRGKRVLVGVISYNHQANVERILEAFGILLEIDYIVAEWHTNKDEMLKKMLEKAAQDGHALGPGDVLLVDDDPQQIYRGQCERLGARFVCFGVDVLDLRDILGIIEEERKDRRASR